MREHAVPGLAVLRLDAHGDGLANGEFRAHEVNGVVGVDLVVVGRVGEGQGEHTLLLQVGLVDTGEGTGDDGETAEVTGLERGVFTGRTLAVVPVTNDNPLDALGLVVTGNARNSAVFAGGDVLDLVGETVLGVGGADEHVVGDVVEMATVLEPLTGHGDVIGGGLALALDEDRSVESVLAVPLLEGAQDLETVRLGRDDDADRGAILRRSLVGLLAGVVAVGGKTGTGRSLEHEVLAILVLQGIGERVEVEGASKGESDDEIGGGNESVGGRVGVVTTSEVTVVGGDD